MSVSATDTFQIDLNGDGDFADANEDITAYVKYARAQHGVTKAGENIARSATLDITLNNASHKFSPEHASALAGFMPGKVVRWSMTYSATTKVLYQGRMGSPQPGVGANEGRETRIHCDGYLAYLQTTPVKFTPALNLYSGAVVTGIMANVPDAPPLLTSWRLGDAVWSVLGSTTTLGAPALTAETGSQQYVYVGDTWYDQTSIYSALRDITQTERGLFFEGRDGSLTFWGREHWVNDLQNAVDATWNGTYITRGRGQYEYGKNLINALDVSFNPRELDSAVSILVPRGPGLHLVRGVPKTVSVAYVDAQGNHIGGFNPIPPVFGVDFTAHTRSNSINRAAKGIAVSVIGYGDHADVTFTFDANSAYGSCNLSRGWHLRGQRYTNYGRQSLHVEDATSRDAYWPSPARSLDFPLLQSEEEAEALALTIINRDKVPRGNFTGVGFYGNVDNAHMVAARDQTIGDRIALSEGQTGANGSYWIVGHTHEWRPGGIHYVSYVFEPVPATTAWILGIANYTELGTTTILA